MAVATITHGDNVFRFRTNPKSVRWTYHVNTSTTTTNGGRVIQVLSSYIDDLTVIADAGGGGWDYIQQAAFFFRDFLVAQKDTQKPGVFEYAPRGYKMSVYAVNFPFRDKWDEVRRPFTMQFKVQEDISGVMEREAVIQEIARLKEGVGWHYNEYNTMTPDDDQAKLEENGAPAGQSPLDKGADRTGPDAALK